MTRIKLKKFDNVRVGAKYIHNLPRLLHVITVLINLRQTLPTGRKNDVSEEYLFSRTGLYPEDQQIFSDVLTWLTESEFYRQTTREGTYYVL